MVADDVDMAFGNDGPLIFVIAIEVNGLADDEAMIADLFFVATAGGIGASLLLLKARAELFDAERLAISIRAVAAELDRIAREPDDALDDHRLIRRGAREDDDIAQFGKRPTQHRLFNEIERQPISEFGDDDPITIEEGRLHRRSFDLERLARCHPDDEGDRHGDKDRRERRAKAFFRPLFLFFRSARVAFARLGTRGFKLIGRVFAHHPCTVGPRGSRSEISASSSARWRSRSRALETPKIASASSEKSRK